MAVLQGSLGNCYSAASADGLDKLDEVIDAWLYVRADGMDVSKQALAAEVPMAL